MHLYRYDRFVEGRRPKWTGLILDEEIFDYVGKRKTKATLHVYGRVDVSRWMAELLALRADKRMRPSMTKNDSKWFIAKFKKLVMSKNKWKEQIWPTQKF